MACSREPLGSTSRSTLSARPCRSRPGAAGEVLHGAQHRQCLERRPRRLGSLVGGVREGADEGLLDGVGGQDAEDHGQSGVELDPLQPGGALAGHEVVMAGVAADDGTQRHHGVHAPGRRHTAGHQGQLEGARHPGHDHAPEVAPGGLEVVQRTRQETVGDGTVEFGAGEADPDVPCRPGGQLDGVERRPDPGTGARLGVGREGGLLRGRHRGPRGGGPCAPAWSAGTRCSPGWVRVGCSPARRCRGRIPRARRTWSGCWS